MTTLLREVFKCLHMIVCNYTVKMREKLHNLGDNHWPLSWDSVIVTFRFPCAASLPIYRSVPKQSPDQQCCRGLQIIHLVLYPLLWLWIFDFLLSSPGPLISLINLRHAQWSRRDATSFCTRPRAGSNGGVIICCSHLELWRHRLIHFWADSSAN